MNILYEQFPKEVRVNGEYYPIATDFREWIRFTELVEDDSVPWRIKCGLLLQWYLDQIPEDIEAAIYALGDFLMCKRMYQDDTEDEEEEQQKVESRYFLFRKMPAVFMQHSGKRMELICSRSTICTGGSSGACLTGCRMIRRLNNGSCTVRLILEQSGIRTNANGSRRSRELFP